MVSCDYTVKGGGDMSSSINIFLGDYQLVVAEPLSCGRHLTQPETLIVTRQDNNQPLAIIRWEEGLVIENRWQLGLTWSGQTLYLSHDEEQPQSPFVEEEGVVATSKAALYYRLGGTSNG